MARADTRPGLSPGSLLKNRYAVLHPFGRESAAFVGRDRESGGAVLLLAVPGRLAPAVARGALVGHPHLVTLLDMAEVPDGAIGVFELLGGRTLEDLLADQGTLPENVAVTCAFALADALGALHRRQAIHGQIRPLAVILGDEPGQGPWLSRAPFDVVAGGYARPEGDPAQPLQEDDLWAMGALVHHMVLGFPPPRPGYPSLAAVPSSAGLTTMTRELIADLLATDPERRIRSAEELRDRLGRLEPRVVPAGVDARGQPDTSLLPHAASRAPVRRARTAPLVAAWAVFLISFGAWIHLGHRELSPVPLAAPQPSVARAKMGAGRGSPETLPLDQLPSGEDLRSCLQGELEFAEPIGTAGLGDFCSTRDPREGAKLLSRAAQSSSKRSDPGRARWKDFGLYRLAAFAIVRRACCREPEPLESGGSGELASSLDSLAIAVVERKPWFEELERTEAILAHPRGASAERSAKSSAVFLRWLEERKHR